MFLARGIFTTEGEKNNYYFYYNYYSATSGTAAAAALYVTDRASVQPIGRRLSRRPHHRTLNLQPNSHKLPWSAV